MPDPAGLLERFRRGAELLSVATTGASNPELDHVSGPGKWSARQIACHLADSECVGAMRFRQILAEDNPTLIWYDEQRWADRLGYNQRKIATILETFRRIRADNYDLLKDLPEEAWLRAGIHSTRGRLTLLDLLAEYAAHAENHAKQILAARQAYKDSRQS